MNGSHSMALTTRNSNFLPGGHFILNHDGNDAPPRPTTPDLRTHSMNSSLLAYVGFSSAGSFSILPSDSI